MSDNIARGLGDLMREAQDSFEADAVEAPADVSTAARSRRRRSGALLGAVAVVACVAVGAAGVGIANGGVAQPAPSVSASPSAAPSEDLSVPLASATIPIAGGPQYQTQEQAVECGAPAPAPTGTVDDFGVTIPAEGPLTIPPDTLSRGDGASIDVLTTYDSEETLPVAQDPVTLLLIKDGKVAGRFMQQGGEPYWSYTNFATFHGFSSLWPAGQFCPEVSTEISPGDDWRMLNPGEYQVIPVAHLWASEESAGLAYLYQEKRIQVGESGFNPRSESLLPGSWDCQRAVDSGVVTRACLGDATSTAIVDMAAGTVTLPYTPTQLVKTFDVTVVGEPVALSITEPFQMPDYAEFSAKALDVSDTIECGTTFDYTTPEPPIIMNGQVPSLLGDGKADFNAFNVGVLPSQTGSGEMGLEHGAQAWLVAPMFGAHDSFENGPGNSKIVGVAEASIAGGNTVSYDRYAGPNTVDLVLTNVRMCDGAELTRGLDSVILDGNIAVTPTGEPQADYTHQLLHIQQYFGP